MKHMRYFLMSKKKLTTIVMELWIIMDKEDLVGLDEDSSEDSMQVILVIFSLHFLVAVWVDEEEDLELEPMWVKILR